MALVPAPPPTARLRVLPGSTRAGARLRRARRRAFAAATAAAVTAAACGSIPEPEAYRATSTSTADAGAAGGQGVAAKRPGEGPEGLSAPAGPTVATVATAATARSGGQKVLPGTDGPEVLVATSNGVLVATPAGVAPIPGPAGTWPATGAIDDLLGGLVVQRAGPGGSPADKAGEIVWLSDGASTPQPVAADGSRLLDVAYSEGSPQVLVLRPSGAVERIRLADRVVTPMERLATDQSLLALSASGNRHAVTVADARCGSLQLRSALGQALTLPAPPPAGCRVPRRPAYRLVALSPDGHLLAYTDVSYRADGLEVTTELAVVDVNTGADKGRRVIAQTGERVTSLSFDGSRAVFVRRTATGAVVAIVLPGTTQPEAQLPVPQPQTVNAVSFMRAPVDAG